MKVLLFLVLGTVGISVGLAKQDLFDITQLPQISPETQQKLGRLLALSLLKFGTGMPFETRGDARVPIFPPLADVMPLENVALEFSPDSGIADFIHGKIYFCDLTFSGLSSLVLDFDLQTFLAGMADNLGIVNLKLTMGTLSIEGKQDLNLTLLSGIISDINYAAVTEDFYFRLNNIEVTVEIRIENLFGTTFDLTGFELGLVIPWEDVDVPGITFHFGDGVLGEGPMTDERWAEISATVSFVIQDVLWDSSFGEPINDFLLTTLADLTQDCNFLLLITGDIDCIGREPLGRRGVGLNERFRSALSEFVTITESDICPNVEPEGPTTTETPGDQPETTPNAGAENFATPTLLAAILSLSFLAKFLI